ncbi:MAG: pyridoxal 5'-phosphate synthase glutaminase subunit PdxT [Dehalococcoidia bacterium]|nr:pyridoxal 5'-phosphate synthase glutaminase subunit PdxT [Dehalococcoidia bacterium]
MAITSNDTSITGLNIKHENAPVVGVLALQGDFREHIEMLNILGVVSCEIRLPSALCDLDALIIPGGESTTIARLVLQYGFLEPLRDFCASGRPVWGTCAGAILLARDVDELDRPGIQAMDIQIQRNAFGRQLQSFQSQVAIDGISDGEFPAVFIRAPAIIDVDASVEILATLPDGKIVAARQRNLLATVFHPELTTDVRLHNLFLSMID